MAEEQTATTFELDGVQLRLQDALEGLRDLPDDSIDLAIADPPYGAASSNIWKLDADHSLPGFGGAWKLANHAWDRLTGLEAFEFTLTWLMELRRVVRPTGSIWIHSTYHNSGMANVACQLLGLEIINEVVWFKRNAFPNLAARRLTASHETILWVHTGGHERRYRFNYELVKRASFPGDSLKQPNKQLRTVWDIPNNKTREERTFGSHPTQKPLRLVERMLLVSGLEGGKLLVAFVGSGTELIAGRRFGMECLGFEIDPEFFDLACRRLKESLENDQASLNLAPL